MPWTDPSTQSSGHVVTATEWNQGINNFLYLAEVNRTTFTADVSITATTVGTANQIVSSGAITYENAPHMIEFFAGRYSGPAQATRVILRDGTTVLGLLSEIPASANVTPVYISYPLTPTAASHTYNIAAWLGGAGTGTFKAGTGGAAGDNTTYLNGYIRVTRIPT